MSADIRTARASSGERTVAADTLGDAYAQFTAAHPDDFAHAITIVQESE